MNQTKLIASAPKIDDLGRLYDEAVSTFVVLDSGAFAKADDEAIENLAILLRSVIVNKGGNPSAITWTAEPIGPQVRLAAVNGRVL